ncbi:MAG: hypothetical protein Q8N04_08415 [Nitrospira sp.]|nr:hypothetical protein [Nitrospira sp.]
MNQIRYLGFALVFVMGCQGTPTVTRTGDVKDIIIGDTLTSGAIAVNPGDEIRWINKRTAPVRVVFIDSVSDKQLSCNNNFGGWMTPSGTAQLTTNQSASVCFRDAGTFRYTVRMESAMTTGELNVPGVITVGGQGGQAMGQTSEQNRGRSSGQTGEQPNDRTSGQASDRISDQKPGRPSDQSSDKPTSPTSSTSTTTTTTTTMPPQ